MRQTAPMTGSAFWRSIETIHDVVYFAPDAKARFEALGLKGFWMGYFASRAAALGTPSAEVVTATFHGFAPATVQRAIPDAWRMADRDAVLAERLDLARDALAPGLEGHDVAALVRRLAGSAAGLDLAGKPLAAAEASLPVPDDAIGALWRRATVLREFRGDCHVAVLVAAGLGGCTANALQVATGRGTENQRTARGWSEQEWDTALADLRARGWVDTGGTATETGRSARERLEDATDRACTAFMDRKASAHALAVTDDLLAAARSVVDAGAITFPNPVGATRP